MWRSKIAALSSGLDQVGFRKIELQGFHHLAPSKDDGPIRDSLDRHSD